MNFNGTCDGFLQQEEIAFLRVYRTQFLHYRLKPRISNHHLPYHHMWNLVTLAKRQMMILISEIHESLGSLIPWPTNSHKIRSCKSSIEEERLTLQGIGVTMLCHRSLYTCACTASHLGCAIRYTVPCLPYHLQSLGILSEEFRFPIIHIRHGQRDIKQCDVLDYERFADANHSYNVTCACW